MNKLTTYFSRLAMIAIAGFAVSSCTTATSPGGGGTTGLLIDSVSANSANSTSINVRWVRQAGDVSADTVIAMNGSTTAATNVVASGNTTVLTGLSEGIMYTISVHAPGGVSQTPVTWMTAERSSGTTRLYETADNRAGEFSGLVLSGTPSAVTVANNQNASSVDLVFASTTDVNIPSGLVLVSPSVTSLSGLQAGRATIFASTFYSIPQPGLDNLYFTGDLNSLLSGASNAYNVPATSPVTGNSEVIAVKTADNHYARVEIVPQPNGQLYGGVAGQNYIDVRVSYQNSVGMPYAGRGHAPALIANQPVHAVDNLVIVRN